MPGPVAGTRDTAVNGRDQGSVLTERIFQGRGRGAVSITAHPPNKYNHIDIRLCARRHVNEPMYTHTFTYIYM